MDKLPITKKQCECVFCVAGRAVDALALELPDSPHIKTIRETIEGFYEESFSYQWNLDTIAHKLGIENSIGASYDDIVKRIDEITLIYLNQRTNHRPLNGVNHH